MKRAAKREGSLSLTLPYPPSGNRYWRHVGRRVVISAEARAYRNAVGARAALLRVRPLLGELCVSVVLYRPARRGDLDNRIKQLLDSLNGVAWEDDSQVAEIHARRAEDKQNPRAVVLVEPVGSDNWICVNDPEMDRTGGLP